MSVAGGIRAGMAFVEIKSHDTEFQASMLRFQEQMVGVGASMRRLGTQVGVFSGAMGLPMMYGLRAAQGFDDALRGLQASVADLSPKQLEAIRAESLRMAAALGVAPEKVAEQFLNLAKAGVSVEDALGGAAKTAVMFAKVGGLEGGAAAELLADAMNVFGTSAANAADTIAAAANASSVDIHQMTQAFAMAGTVAGMAGQGIDDTSAALAVLGKNMMKGSDAGTSLKTMLLRLTAPTGEAKAAMMDLGLTARSFTDAAGKPIRLPEIIETLNQKLGKMNAVARRDVLTRLFGADAIRAAEVLTRTGKQGLEDMLGAMRDAVPLSQQFGYLMSGVSGFFSALDAGAKIVAVAFQSSLGPSLNYAGKAFLAVSEVVAALVNGIPGLSPIIAGTTVAAGFLSVALFAVAGASALVNFTMTNLPLKVSTALAWGATAAFGALSKAIGGVAAAIYAIPGIGWIAALVTGLTALAGAAWWFYSKPKEGPASAKGAPGGAAMGNMQQMAMQSMGIDPAQFQSAMQQASAMTKGAARPILGPGEQQALNLANVENLLRQLLDVSKSQRPAWT